MYIGEPVIVVVTSGTTHPSAINGTHFQFPNFWFSFTHFIKHIPCISHQQTPQTQINPLNEINPSINSMNKIPPYLPLFLAFFLAGAGAGASHDYRDALSKAILFFEGQRSGFLPEDQRMTWRGHSGLGDGWTHRTDLTGGYYDAGDNVKFGFPMAFTATMMAWSVIEFGEGMPRNELRNALVAIRWATDYLLKTVSQLPDRIFVQVCINGF